MKTLEQLQDDLESARAGMNTGDIEDAVAAIEDFKKKKLVDGLLAVEALIAQSDGVIGLHRNGDSATWDELRAGGRLESWLSEFDEALRYI